MGKAVLEHNDSQASVLSYGTEDLAGYRELPQTTTRLVLGCAGASSTLPCIDTAADSTEHCFVMRISQFSQIVSPTKLVLRSTKAAIDTGLAQPTKWCVLLYPNGNQPDRQGYVSLYLYRWDKQTEPVAATFRFSLLNSAREKSFTVDVAEKKMFGHTAGNSKSLGAPKFVSREDLFNSSWGLLVADTLTVICELRVFSSSGDSPANRVSPRGRGIRFHHQVEELHYPHTAEEGAGVAGKKGKADKLSVGLFNPIKFLHSMEHWRKLETEI